ncbi:hypothetical protein FRB94_000979 [Tulasnella sp. JGI-2019a]|nr:hypothetical protein FRB94_000979 [Tulasnella sp. JGI-2019a]
MPTPALPALLPSDTQLLLVQINPKQLALDNHNAKLIVKKLQDAITEAKITNAGKTIHICTVRALASKDILISTHNKEDADCLHKDDAWVPLVSDSLCLCQEVYPLIVHCVPTTFDPTSPSDIKALKEANPDPLGSFKWMCWGNAKKVLDKSK